MVDGTPEKLRRQLESAMESAWKTPEAQQIRKQLENVVYGTDYDDALRECMEADRGKECYKEAAKEAGIREQFKSIWGKGR